MTWVRLDDHLWSDPRWLALTAAARDIFVRLLTYCGDRLNDGRMAWTEVALAIANQPPMPRARRIIAELAGAGYVTDDGATVAVVGPEQYLRPAAEVEAERAYHREWMRLHREQERAAKLAALHGAVQPAQPDALQPAVRTPVPSRPVPGDPGEEVTPSSDASQGSEGNTEHGASAPSRRGAGLRRPDYSSVLGA